MNIVTHHFPTIGSTNTWAKQNAHSFDQNAITLVTADHQTAGRGRLNRQWISPPNENIYATYCLFLDKYRPDISNLPQVAAISIAEILTPLNLSPQLKWPNDVLVNNKKIAGILSESTPIDNAICLIIGIGLNVNMPPETLNTIDRPATSILNETNQTHPITPILNSLTHSLTHNISLLLQHNFSLFLHTYTLLLQKPKHPITLLHNNTPTTGTLHSINNDGSLNLLLPNNSILTFHSGEILP